MLTFVLVVGGGTTTLDVEELPVLDLLRLVLLLAPNGFQPTLFGRGCNFSARAISTGREDAMVVLVRQERKNTKICKRFERNYIIFYHTKC